MTGDAALAATVQGVVADTGFSGVVRVDRGGEVLLAKAFGLADRGHGVANTVDTRFGIASGAKGFTALTVMSLVVDGTLRLDTTARSVLGDDLALIDDGVTIEHLLGHRSGIGDYLDEDAGGEITDYVVAVPAQALFHSDDYLQVLDGFASKFAPDSGFSYCNGGYVVLAIIAERASGVPFHDLVRQRVFAPAGMASTEYLRNDELPGDVAIGYLPVADAPLRTNVFHLPLRGSGDGGLTSCLDDMHAFWPALMAGAIVPVERVAEMLRPRSDPPENDHRYGLGFWLDQTGDAVNLEGYDAGVSFRTTHSPSAAVTHTVISNTSNDAWPMIRALDAHLFG